MGLFSPGRGGWKLRSQFPVSGREEECGYLLSAGIKRQRGHWTSPYGEGEAASQGSQRW